MSQPADHTVNAQHSSLRSALQGVREAIPLLGGYIPVALSFGLVATQAG
ncbi:MAG: branched-chain amino acid ABC transporter permease, partial [Halomonas sp.]|nr:branched-chain amino acid ABC transporter permease [Halomonas sp.]